MSPSRPPDPDRDVSPTRWKRRQARQQAKRRRVAKHGASLRRVYRDAVLKRAASRRRPS